MTEGTLGPVSLQKLAAIQQARERLAQEEAQTLALVAEAQGFRPTGPVRFDYDLSAATWRALPADAVPGP